MHGPEHFERVPHETHGAFLSVLGFEVPTVANEEATVFKIHVSPLEVQELPAPETLLLGVAQVDFSTGDGMEIEIEP